MPQPPPAQLKTLLLAQAPGPCFSCHKHVKEQMATQKVHAPAEDCLTCHQPHAAGAGELARPATGTSSAASATTPRRQGLPAAHLGIDAKAMDCVSCHDPHASKDPKFFKSVGHPPFAGARLRHLPRAEKKK